MPAGYPVVLDVTRWTILIVGGGAVAARKARGLLEAGAASVRCVSPKFSEELSAKVNRIAETYRPGHLDGADLVFAATDSPEVNDAVVRDAHARHLLVSRAEGNDEEPGDFIVPAQLRRGSAMIAVSAASPALAAAIRDRLNELFDPRWQLMADAMQELRGMVKASAVNIDTRRRIFRELAGEDALSVVAQGGTQGLVDWLLEKHPELRHA